MAYQGGPGNDSPTAGEYDAMFGYEGDDSLATTFRGQIYLDGGSGDDFLWADTAATWGVLVGGVGNDRIRGGYGPGIDTILGGDGDDDVAGGFTSQGPGNLLDGGSGRDRIEGCFGNDTIYGGEGDDSGDRIVVGPGGTWSPLPGLYGNWGDDHIDGGAGNDLLDGSGGNDVLIGGTGADAMRGGLGNDTYDVDSAGDLVVENGTAEGIDTVRASVSYVLGTHCENLLLIGSAVRGTGNALANRVTGNAVANILTGGSGKDVLDGGGGADRLRGDDGDDRLLGRDGDDILTGSFGRDAMTGGRGRDRFVFDDRHTDWSARWADVITDFSGRAGDRVDLRAVDANRHVSGDQNFTFVGTAEFTAAGQVRYKKSGTYTLVYLNIDADLEADSVIKLKGAMDLGKSWFVL